MSALASMPKATSFAVSCATVDDFMPRNPLIDLAGGGRPFAVAPRQSPGRTPLEPDLLTLGSDNVMHHFRPDNSDAGWREETITLPNLGTDATVRLDASGAYPSDGEERMVVVVAVKNPKNPGFLALQHKVDGGWKLLDVPYEKRAFHEILLAMGRSKDSGFARLAGGKAMTFYACVPEGGFVGMAFDQYGVLKAIVPKGLTRGMDHLAANQTREPIVIRRERDGLRIIPGRGDFDRRDELPIVFGAESYFTPLALGPSPDSTFVRPVTDHGQICRGAVVRDSAGGAAFVPIDRDGRPGVATVLSGLPQGVMSLQGVAEDDGNFTFFATDGLGLIWRARWKGGPVQWEPLGQRGQRLTAPQTLGGQPCVYLEGRNGGVDRLALTTEGEWVRQTVDVGEQTPEAEPAIVHAIQIATVTAQSDPTGETPMHVLADQPVLVEHEGRLVRLTPDRPYLVVSNATGSVRFKMRAAGLEAPVLTVKYPEGSTPPARFRPQDAALKKLAGTDQDFPVDATTLKAAGLMPAETAPDDAAKLAKTIRATAHAAYAEGAADAMQFQKRRRLAAEPLAEVAPVGVRITRTENGFTISDSVPGPDFLSDAAAAAGGGDGWGAFWGWVRGAWDKVTDFVIEVADKVVRVAAQIGKDVQEFFAKSARRIGEGLQGLFAFLNRLGSDLIDAAGRAMRWVAEKLGWDDVIRAKTAVKSYTLQSLTDIEHCIGHAMADALSRGIGWAKGQVDTVFDKAIGLSQGEPGKQSGPVTQSPVRGNLQSHGATALSVQHAVPDKPAESVLFTPSPELKAKLLELGEHAKAFGKGDQVANILKSLAAVFEGKTSVVDGLKVVLGEVLDGLRRLVILALDVADVIQRLVLELVAYAIRMMRTVLETPISKLGSAFAWVNSLYKRISGGADLSMIDLSCLLFVTPGVILHHLILRKPIIPPDTPQRPTETFLATAPALLDVGKSNDPPKPVTDGAVWFFNLMKPVFNFCSAVWTFLRSIVCRAEDALRTAVIMGDEIVSANLAKVFGWLVRIVDWGLMIWMLADVYFTYLSGWVEEKLKTVPGLVVPMIAVLVVVCILGMLEPVISVVWAAITPTVTIWALAFLAIPIAGATFGYNLYQWVEAAPPSGAPEKVKAAFHLDRVAGLLNQLRGLVQLGVPGGAMIARSGDPVTGGVLIGLNMSVNVLFYGLSGLLMGASAILKAT